MEEAQNSHATEMHINLTSTQTSTKPTKHKRSSYKIFNPNNQYIMTPSSIVIHKHCKDDTFINYKIITNSISDTIPWFREGGASDRLSDCYKRGSQRSPMDH
mmetsp:Transcript_3752/g.4330  ORF Transcript_3752/g.4330 Transcript_3752/m.4330 type:complete len:102 (-) Transcript_3752:991-1296(-)